MATSAQRQTPTRIIGLQATIRRGQGEAVALAVEIRLHTLDGRKSSCYGLCLSFVSLLERRVGLEGHSCCEEGFGAHTNLTLSVQPSVCKVAALAPSLWCGSGGLARLHCAPDLSSGSKPKLVVAPLGAEAAGQKLFSGAARFAILTALPAPARGKSRSRMGYLTPRALDGLRDYKYKSGGVRRLSRLACPQPCIPTCMLKARWYSCCPLGPSVDST